MRESGLKTQKKKKNESENENYTLQANMKNETEWRYTRNRNEINELLYNIVKRTNFFVLFSRELQVHGGDTVVCF